MEMIESLIQEGMDLSHIPVQPLYQVIKSLPTSELAELLPRFSKEQRQTFLDLDLWHRDDLDVNQFGMWLEVYHRSDSEEIVKEFVEGHPFALYLKGAFNVWTFDVEEPLYPDHDNYFLTEDNQLLFEFHEDYEYVTEARDLVRKIYFELGVENAYVHLFKIIVDSYMIVQEDEYQDKCFRLKELGFVDHMESLEIHNTFPSTALLDNFIKKKMVQTATIETLGRSQVLPENSLLAFRESLSGISEELANVEDPKRQDYLHFNFLRMVNSGLTLEDAMKNGTVAMTRVGNKARAFLELGFDYIKRFENDHSESLLERFDFTDFFKVGNSLISFVQKKLKKGMATPALNKQDGFLGRYWVEFLDNSFDYPVKFAEINREEGRAQSIVNCDLYQRWSERAETLLALLPFADQFYLNYRDLAQTSKIRDEFYLNYSVDEIDVESILMSTFANYALGNFDKENVNRMGLTLDEYKMFAKGMISKNSKVDETSEFSKKCEEYATKFGMGDVPEFKHYLLGILAEQMEGYDYDGLSVEDFKHVGGPIILAT